MEVDSSQQERSSKNSWCQVVCEGMVYMDSERDAFNQCKMETWLQRSEPSEAENEVRCCDNDQQWLVKGQILLTVKACGERKIFCGIVIVF